MCVGSLDWNVKHLSGQDIGGSDAEEPAAPEAKEKKKSEDFVFNPEEQEKTATSGD